LDIVFLTQGRMRQRRSKIHHKISFLATSISYYYIFILIWFVVCLIWNLYWSY